MESPYLSDAVLYLINTIFSLYILLVALRFLLQMVRADARSPVSQFLLAATNPPLRPLRRIIPVTPALTGRASSLCLRCRLLSCSWSA